MENITRSQWKLKVETSEQRELWKSRVSKSYLALVSKPVAGFQKDAKSVQNSQCDCDGSVKTEGGLFRVGSLPDLMTYPDITV